MPLDRPVQSWSCLQYRNPLSWFCLRQGLRRGCSHLFTPGSLRVPANLPVLNRVASDQIRLRATNNQTIATKLTRDKIASVDSPITSQQFKTGQFFWRRNTLHMFLIALFHAHDLGLINPLTMSIPAYPAYFSVFRTPKNTAVRCTLCVKIIRSC
jgi:hypothetical protein